MHENYSAVLTPPLLATLQMAVFHKYGGKHRGTPLGGHLSWFHTLIDGCSEVGENCRGTGGVALDINSWNSDGWVQIIPCNNTTCITPSAGQCLCEYLSFMVVSLVAYRPIGAESEWRQTERSSGKASSLWRSQYRFYFFNTATTCSLFLNKGDVLQHHSARPRHTLLAILPRKINDDFELSFFTKSFYLPLFSKNKKSRMETGVRTDPPVTTLTSMQIQYTEIFFPAFKCCSGVSHNHSAVS